MNTDTLFRKGHLRTFTGIYVPINNNNPDLIQIKDIAKGLAHESRFAGQTKKRCSVAEHSITVCRLVKEPELKLAALLHDASEAYLKDIPSPIKEVLPDYKSIEDNWMQLIADKYGFEYPLHESIKSADRRALEWEWDNYVISTRHEPMSAEMAHDAFLREFNHLIKYHGDE